ncbi:MAG: STELLO glycosyltransferase family protein [Thermodesulfovibrionia bacterium]|nr:STELLO glycosyltransferase family protein [Thermodesulfovibrionia bacterium]
MSSKAVVITTIQYPTKAVNDICRQLGDSFNIVIVGDKKSPQDFSVTNAGYLSIKDQEASGLKLAAALPFNHYARKNIGYLIAIKDGAELILETDDDNIPYEDFGTDLKIIVNGELISAKGWFNVYKEFSNEHIWPRGFPLEKVSSETKADKNSFSCECHIQQFLADRNPDVDAVFRLIHPYRDINFSKRSPVILDKGTMCPFNSQNTVTYKDAFPLLYLPSNVSFRMTDIWRSFISQAVMWSKGWLLSFHSSTVYQERNVHNLLKDFEQEIPGYLNNQTIIDILNSISFSGSVENRLYQAYEQLSKDEIIPKDELKLVEYWLEDLGKI